MKRFNKEPNRPLWLTSSGDPYGLVHLPSFLETVGSIWFIPRLCSFNGWQKGLVRFVRGMGIENPTMEREVILISIHRDRASSYGERVWTNELLVEMNHIPLWNSKIYVSRLSSQLEMRSEGNSFLHWISLMWKWKDNGRSDLSR